MEPWSCKVLSRTKEAAFEIRQREVNEGETRQVRLGEGPNYKTQKRPGGMRGAYCVNVNNTHETTASAVRAYIVRRC